MNEEELAQYVEHLRSQLDKETYSQEDAYNQVWNVDNELTADQREQVHQALELSAPAPCTLGFFAADAIVKKV